MGRKGARTTLPPTTQDAVEEQSLHTRTKVRCGAEHSTKATSFLQVFRACKVETSCYRIPWTSKFLSLAPYIPLKLEKESPCMKTQQ